jgi:hypothetical protein
VLSRNMLGGGYEIIKERSQCSRYASRNSNPGPQKYETHMAIASTDHKVRTYEIIFAFLFVR